MTQLKLNKDELIKIGFEECFSIGDELNESKQYFKISTLNGYFYYNPEDDTYVWYHNTIIGNTSNHLHLNIINKPELFVVLSAFNVKFNIII